MARDPRSSARRGTLQRLVRGAAGAAIAAGIAAPLLRKRLRLRPGAVTASLIAAPFGLAVLRQRTKARDVALYALQMWGFTMAHELPYDDPERLRRRLHVRYPIDADRALGLGELPNVRLQHALSREGRTTGLDRFLAIVHWAWFLQPHATLLYLLLRDERRFARAARQMSAAYDLGCVFYATVPTAPPWWASERGYTDTPVRRIMVEVGEDVWGRAWPALYRSLGGNPWAAMPSLHFGTATLAAILLAESGPGAGTVGWAYAGTLGLALVYLGEHYLIDLIAGAALVAAVRAGDHAAAPVAGVISRAVQRLERFSRAS